jgi:hypothetical protein
LATVRLLAAEIVAWNPEVIVLYDEIGLKQDDGCR